MFDVSRGPAQKMIHTTSTLLFAIKKKNNKETGSVFRLDLNRSRVLLSSGTSFYSLAIILWSISNRGNKMESMVLSG